MRQTAKQSGDSSQLLAEVMRLVHSLQESPSADVRESWRFFPDGVNHIRIRLKLERVGELELEVDGKSKAGAATDTSAYIDTIAPVQVIAARGKDERVAKAKQLLAEGKTYPQGCSGFVCEVLGIPWEPANQLMGDSPTSVGSDNVYHDLEPGDIAGWKSDTDSGHVTVYIGESGMKFIDVKGDNQKPRKVGKGYGPQEVFKSSRF